jgi:hypothetical protein
MLFRVIEHYHLPEEEIIISIEPKNECLLCLQINTDDDKLTPVDLKTQQMYLKMCSCGGWFHITCLHNWYAVSNSCPICRVCMKKHDHANNFGLTLIVFFVHFCNMFWFLFTWGVIGILGSYNVYTTYVYQSGNEDVEEVL